MTTGPQLVYRNDRIEIFVGNELRGYVEDDILFSIDKDGYAVQIATIEHRVEIIEKWKSWLTGGNC